MNHMKVDSIVLRLDEKFSHFGRRNLEAITREVLALSATRGDAAGCRTDSADNSDRERQARRDREQARRDEAMADLRQQYRQPVKRGGAR